MIGAYDGFDYTFPTLHCRVAPPSGTLMIGQFSDLLHAVAGGTGVRATAVYCQHELMARGEKKLMNGTLLKLIGARMSKDDVALGDRCATIECVKEI